MAKKFLKKISNIATSNNFFYAILALFIFQAAWIAVSAVYPQPFDENTHLGLIKLYAQHWSPFLSDQLQAADSLGAVTRDPSYLYHYLMSFPYRIFALFFHSLPAQVIFLRLLNIAFFAASLVVFRMVLQKTNASPGLINSVFLFFVLIPVVPFLAGQINYDSLLMLMVAAALLLTLRFTKAVDKKQPSMLTLGLGVLSVAMIGSLVKVEFIPILVAIVVLIIYKTGRLWLSNKTSFIKVISYEIKFMKHSTIALLAATFLVSSGLFFQRYGVNYLQYGSPIPACDQVMTIEQCSANGPWKRGYDAEKTKGSVNSNPVRYSVSWVVRMFIYTFYTRSGGSPQAYYVNVNPLPVIAVTAISVFSIGLIAFLFYVKDILRNDKALALLLGISVFYCLLLWTHLYLDFLQIGQKFGINGRYLFPAILPLLLGVGLAYQRLLTKQPLLKPLLLTIVFLLFLQGGGILTFIVGSNQHWYWDNQFVRNLNTAAQKITKPFIVERIGLGEALKEKALNRWHGQ